MINLQQHLISLRPQITIAAQLVYDQWEPDEFGGGICDEISSAISDVLSVAGIDSTEGGHDGDEHSYVVAYDDTEAFVVDIPYDVYETGGGYSWEKTPDVVFSPNDVAIVPVDRPDWI